jgi:RHS repeat-associated protein
MSDSTGVTSYAYDLRDRLLTKSTPEGSLTYTYDVAGNRKTVQSDSGAYNVTYEYDELNRLRSVTDNVAGGGSTTYHYDHGGRLTSYDYPSTVTTALTYDTVNRVQSLKIGSGLGTANENIFASYSYSFYATGNRHTVTELSGRNVNWTYDNLWRLTNETIGGTPGTNGSLGYNYDNAGNRLSRSSSVTGIANQTNTYDNNDRLLSDGWDPNGNTLTSSGNHYVYDSENRLLSLNTSQVYYAYDGDSQLVQKTAGGITTMYLVDSENPTGYTQIAEERVSGALAKTYVYGAQRISLRDATGLHHYGYDAHSGVRILFDGSGNLTDSYDYDAFGVVIELSGTTANEFTYRGERTDASLSLQYLRARWLDPSRGTFRTRDRFEDADDSSTRLNRYIYVLQNPINKADPLGYCDCTVQSQTIGTATAFSTTIESLAVRSFVRPILMAAGAALAGAATGIIARELTRTDRPDDGNRMIFQVQGPGFNSSVPAIASPQKGVTVLHGTIALEAAWLGVWADLPGGGDNRIYQVYNYAIIAAAEFAVLQQIYWMSTMPANGGWLGGNPNHSLDFPTPYGPGRVDVFNAKGHNLRYLW